jgi:CDP-diacylglycerol--glycerol-3-phosphate 3-phosphatidyltransferase
LGEVTAHGIGASAAIFLAVCALFGSALASFVALALTGRRPRSAEMAQRGETLLLPLFLRDYWDWVITPVTRRLIAWRVDPDAITWTSALVAAVAGGAYAAGWFGLGGWLYILTGTLDMFDGKVARATGRVTRAGAFVDSTLDRYTELFVLVGLAYYFRGWSPLHWAAVAAMAGSLMVSYTRARGEGLGVSCREGGMQRAERIVSLGLAGILGKLAEAFVPTSRTSERLVAGAVVLVAVTSNVTALQRFLSIRRALRAQETAAQDVSVLRHPAARQRPG